MSTLLLVVAFASATFTPGPSMLVPRADHTATLLEDGRVLIAGGSWDDARCEIYDPATGEFRETGQLSRPRPYATATLLRDGRVLIVGGGVIPHPAHGIGFGQYGDSSAEIFDPRTETWTAAGTMSVTRYAHASALLPDGRVLVTGGGYGYIGGFSFSLFPHASMEIYDPATNTFTPAPAMKTKRWNHTATTLADGSVLLIGTPNDQDAAETAVELFEGTAVRALPVKHEPLMNHTATLLNDGRVLVAGRNVAELYDPGTGAFDVVGPTAMTTDHFATRLTSGAVLLTSGSGCEIFDPELEQLFAIDRMREPRSQHRATLLRDGTVLITGGRIGGLRVATTEVFVPRAPRRRGVRR